MFSRIGVLTGWQYYWTATPLSYLDPLLQGMCQAGRDLGCQLLLGCGMGSSAASSDPLRPAWPLPLPEADFVPVGPWNTDGLIVVNPLPLPALARDIQAMIAAGHPVQFVGAGERGPTLAADNSGGIRAAMSHLVAHGHRRIAFIAGSPEDLEGDSGDRLRAYHAALGERGLPADPRLLAYGRHVYDGGYAAMGEILAGGAPFTAVLASNDESAMGAIQALADSGMRVPDDVAVIGFDDRPEGAAQTPALSSVRVPLFRMGYRAVELLLQQIAGAPAPDSPVRIATRLVARESCGCGGAPSPPAPLPLRERRVGSRSDGGTPLSPLEGEGGRGGEGSPDLAHTMAAALLAQADGMSEGAALAACRRLVAGVDRLAETLDATLREPAFAREDAHIWQAAISALARGAGGRLGQGQVERARELISAHMRRQHQRHVVGEQWAANRMGVLTAQLQAALDEEQVFAIVAQHLPEMGIERGWVALFAEGAAADAMAHCAVRSLTEPARPAVVCRSRDFPPAALLPADEPRCLALLPLVSPRGQLGFVAFDSDQLKRYGAIVQQLAAALHTAHLYREATEGRRLAEEADQLKSRFLSTVSHELRTPLNLIVGLSRILVQADERGGRQLPQSYRDDLARISASAQHLGGLIGDVLDLASSDAGQLRLANEYVDLGQSLRMVVETGGRLAEDKGLRWSARLPARGPWVWGDRTRLRQVALNLISNAVKFTARGAISLTVEDDGDQARVSVTDSGLGIPPDEQEAIFSEFRRSGRSVTRGYSGLGLGLAICKRLIELHGGAIGLRSSGEEGAGSTFFFTLPTVPPPAAPGSGGAEGRPAADRVLVLSAGGGAGERLADHLGRRGLAVQLAAAADDAGWEQRLAAAPHAVVLDMSGQPDQGWAALKALKTSPLTRDVPVIFSALGDEGGAMLELDYLTKPVEPAALTDALDQHGPAGAGDPGGRTVLVVDDDLATLDMNARIVQAHWPDARVLRAGNGREALAIVARQPVDLLLLDLIMPGVDGFAVLEALRASDSTRDVPVIVLTGQVLSQDDIARLDRGVAAVMSKGLFSVDETLAHLDAALERRRKLGGEAQRLVRQAMAYIHEHYAEPIARHDLARHVGMAEDYLTACFHKEVGMTPIAYLNRYRINQAKLLLCQGRARVTDIAGAVGFADSGYFSRLFRREVGVSPDAYRRKHS